MSRSSLASTARDAVVSTQMAENETKRMFIRLRNGSSTGGKYTASLNERTFAFLRFLTPVLKLCLALKLSEGC